MNKELSTFIDSIIEKAHKENREVTGDEVSSIYNLRKELALKDFKEGKIKRFTGPRMTEPNETAIYSTTEYYELLPGAALSKLGQLEDIEEELGVDLITLFKALENGIYSNFYDDISTLFYNYDELILQTFNSTLIATRKDNKNICVLLEEYGKTWALTKEELENGK